MKPSKRSLFILLCAGIVLLLAPITAAGQATQNPFTSRADVAEGERLFQKNCVLCHGGDGTGGRGPDLTRGFYRRGNSDAQLFQIVQGGLSQAGMPWLGFSDRNSWQVIAYVRSLGARGGQQVPGDPDRGHQIFFGSGDCGTCHMVNGDGGRQGPDLSWVGWARAPDYLREAILDPNADVDPRWWTGQVVTADGTEIEGYLVDEDQFTVRMMDGNDTLHAFVKADLDLFLRMKTSAMPRANLSEEELTDLVAFLAGLRGGGTDQ